MYDLVDVLNGLCKGSGPFTQVSVCSVWSTKPDWKVFGIDETKLSNELLYCPMNKPELCKILSRQSCIPEALFKNAEDTGIFLGSVVLWLLFCCCSANKVKKVRNFFQLQEQYAQDFSDVEKADEIKKLIEKLQTIRRMELLFEELLVLPEGIRGNEFGIEAEAEEQGSVLKEKLKSFEVPIRLSESGKDLFIFWKSVFEVATENQIKMEQQAMALRGEQTAALNTDGSAAILAVLLLADNDGLPAKLLEEESFRFIPLVKKKVSALMDCKDVIKEDKSLPFDSATKVPYYTASPQKRGNKVKVLSQISKSQDEREFFKQFFAGLSDTLVIHENIATLNMDGGEWYKRLLIWQPFCKKLAEYFVEAEPSQEEKIKIKEILEEVLGGETYQYFLKRLVHYFWYLRDAARAQVIFRRCVCRSEWRNNLTEWLREEKQNVALRSASGEELNRSFMMVKELLEKGEISGEEQLGYAMDIVCTCIFSCASRTDANAKEINALLQSVASRFEAFPVNGYKREVYTVEQLQAFSAEPEKQQLVIQISEKKGQFLLDILCLADGYSLRPIVSPRDADFCCPSKKADYCSNPHVTCEDCAEKTDRISCQLCEFRDSCDIRKAYSQMRHSFFLFKTTWEQELPNEMALKGLRHGSYLAYGVFRQDDLVSYVDVTRTPEDMGKFHIGFAFTMENYQGKKFSHALINHVRMLHPHHVIYMTTNTLNSSMLQCCKNLGFHETERKNDRICPDVATLYMEVPPLLKA